MIELLLLYYFCKKMGTTLRDKGWSTTFWMQLTVIIAWFGSMIVAGFGYGVYLVVTKGPEAAEHPDMMVAYPLCFLAGLAGVGLLFLIVSLFPSHELPRTWTITADAR
jgi:drug/metabolite transporter (DMT)-like permease